MTTDVLGKKHNNPVQIPSLGHVLPYARIARSTSKSPSLLPSLQPTRPSDEPFEPPSKRSKYSHDAGRSTKSIQTSNSKATTSKSTGPSLASPLQDANGSDPSSRLPRKAPQTHRPPLVPARPGLFYDEADAPRSLLSLPARDDLKANVTIKAYTPEAPLMAPKYPRSSAADFSPWRGHHQEDTMNESTAKNGFYDKPLSFLNESASARSSIWSGLKIRTGFDNLSSVFLAALHLQQAHGRTMGSSIFKPPPRVTLTDAKREAWLNYLAKPAIPLRRLSRTIPHGIRSKLLLDQCLSKMVPISRAIWLIKCVGANEIRAFRRKGASGAFTVGGEAKWTKDWTSNIEQFLLENISDLNAKTDGWNITYRIRLATQMYKDRLMDQGQYLDWLVKSTRESETDHLWVWLLLLGIHLPDIVPYRKGAASLVQGLLGHFKHLQTVNIPDADGHQALLDGVSRAVQLTFLSNAADLLLPLSLHSREPDIEHQLFQGRQPLSQMIVDLRGRKSGPLGNSHFGHGPTHLFGRRAVLALLDSLNDAANPVVVAQECLRLKVDPQILVSTALRWTSSLERCTIRRVYAATRLFRMWSRHDMDVQGLILGFLGTDPDPRRFSKSHLYRLCSELVCSGHFTISRYLQWLMAQGNLSKFYGSRTVSGLIRALNEADDKQELPVAVALLFELPTLDLPTHVKSLRTSLLHRLQSPYSEGPTLSEVTQEISGRLPSLVDGNDSSRTLSDDELSSASGEVKYDASRWLRHVLNATARQCSGASNIPPPLSRSDFVDGRPQHAVTAAQFRTIYRLIVCFEEFSILADIIESLYCCVHAVTLLEIVDTLNYHHDIFMAIGASGRLFQHIHQHVRHMQTKEPLDQQLLTSLADLGGRLPNTQAAVRGLRDDLLRLKASQSAAACSPISDNMLETVSSSQPIFLDELDHAFSTGTRMDEKTHSRVFQMLVGHIRLTWTDGKSYSRLTSLLSTLQGHDARYFEHLMASWFHDLLLTGDRPKLGAILPQLICMQLLSLETVLLESSAALDKPPPHLNRVLLIREIVDLLVTKMVHPWSEIGCRSYRLHDAQLHAFQHCPALILHIYSFAAENAIIPCHEMDLDSARLSGLLEKAVGQRARQDEKLAIADAAGQKSIERYVFGLAGLPNPDVTSRLDWIEFLESVDDMNMFSAQLQLDKVLGCPLESAGPLADSFSESMIECVSKSPLENSVLFSRLLVNISGADARAIRRHLERTLLELLFQNTIPRSSEADVLVDGLLILLQALELGLHHEDSEAFLVGVCDKLSQVLKLVREVTHNKELLPSPSHLAAVAALLIMHESSFHTQQDSVQRLLPRVVSLLGLLVSSLPARFSHASHELFVALCLLSDCLSDGSWLIYKRQAHGHLQFLDPRTNYLLGPSQKEASEYLQLIAHDSTLSGARPNSQAVYISPVQKRARQEFSFRQWEMMPDATPVPAENDTSLSMVLFGARRSLPA